MPSNLEEKLKKVINNNYVKVINTLDPKTLLTHLRETGILTVGGYDAYYEELNNMLTHGKIKQDINIRLLEILYTRDRWWVALLKALHQCELKTIIDILEGALSEKDLNQLRREIGDYCKPRSNGRPPRSERRVYTKNRPPSDSDSDLSSLTENGQYHSLPEQRSRRRTFREAEVTRQRHSRSDCNAAPDAMTQNILSWTNESDGYVPNGCPNHPEEQGNPSHLHRQPCHQSFPSELRVAHFQTSMHYGNGSSHKHSLYRGSSDPCPGYRPTEGTTALARSSSAPSGPQHSDELWYSSTRQSPNPTNELQGSRLSGQVSSVLFSPTVPVVTASALSDQATQQGRATEGGPRTSGPLDIHAFGPQADRPTSCNDYSYSAPLQRQELINVNMNTPLRHVPMQLLKLLYRLDHDHKWSDLASILTDKFLSEDHNKILASNSEEPKTKQVLDFFKATEGDRATLGRLITALQKMQRKDLLDDITQLTGLTFQDEEDEINEHKRKNSWAGTSSNMVDLDIPTPEIKPPDVSSAARADAIGQSEQRSISSSIHTVTDPYKCKEDAKQSCIGTTEDEVSQSSITGARSGVYVSNQVYVSQLEKQKKLEEAVKCENRRNQNSPTESPNERHQTEREHGNPPCPESDSSDENNSRQNSSNNADVKPKPELQSKVINTSPNRDTITNMNQQPMPFATPAAASSSPLPISVNATGTEAEACQHGRTIIYHPPQIPVQTKDHGSPPSEKLSGSVKAAKSEFPGQVPNFDKIPPFSLQSSVTSSASQSIPGHTVEASNNPNHLLGSDTGVAAVTCPVVGDKTSPNNYVAQHETMLKTIADSSNDSITEDANTASKFTCGQHSSSVEAPTPLQPIGATGNQGPVLHVTSDGSTYLVGTLGSSILDKTQRSTYQEDSQDIGERHILTMSEASVCPSFIARYDNKTLEQSMYYERVQGTKGCVEDEFISLDESGEEEEEEGELTSGHTEDKKKYYQVQGHSEAEGSRSINGGLIVPDGTADSRSITPTDDRTSSAASPPFERVSASSTIGCMSAAVGDTSIGNAGTSASTNRGTSFSSVISSGLKLFKLFAVATDVNNF